jgi:hypothetical protein
MDFHLRYRGPLPANGSPKDKAAIREYFSPQIEELFGTARELKGVRLPELATATRMRRGTAEFDAPASGGPNPDEQFFYRFPLEGYSFLPLVTRRHCLVCELDLMFLRREEPGAIVGSGGDLDNRLKTLLDALRLPYDASELGCPPNTSGIVKDVFCLLEDDALITRLGLQTGRLLGRCIAQSPPKRLRTSSFTFT